MSSAPGCSDSAQADLAPQNRASEAIDTWRETGCSTPGSDARPYVRQRVPQTHFWDWSRISPTIVPTDRRQGSTKRGENLKPACYACRSSSSPFLLKAHQNSPYCTIRPGCQTVSMCTPSKLTRQCVPAIL